MQSSATKTLTDLNSKKTTNTTALSLDKKPIAIDISKQITTLYCDGADWVRLSRVSKGMKATFQDSVNHFHQLQEMVMTENIATEKFIAERMNTSTDYWRFIVQRGPGKENGRTWKSVSPIEFAAWKGCLWMVETLLSQLPKEGKQKALDQLRAIREKGTEHGKLFSGLQIIMVTFANVFGDQTESNRIHQEKAAELDKLILKLEESLKEQPVAALNM